MPRGRKSSTPGTRRERPRREEDEPPPVSVVSYFSLSATAVEEKDGKVKATFTHSPTCELAAAQQARIVSELLVICRSFGIGSGTTVSTTTLTETYPVKFAVTISRQSSAAANRGFEDALVDLQRNRLLPSGEFSMRIELL